MNLYFTVFTVYTTLPLSVYSRVLGYFWLSRLKPKIPKNIKKHKKAKNQKKQISNFKKPLVFSTPVYRAKLYNAVTVSFIVTEPGAAQLPKCADWSNAPYSTTVHTMGPTPWPDPCCRAEILLARTTSIIVRLR